MLFDPSLHRLHAVEIATGQPVHVSAENMEIGVKSMIEDLEASVASDRLAIAALELRVSELSEQLRKLHAEFHNHDHAGFVVKVVDGKPVMQEVAA